MEKYITILAAVISFLVTSLSGFIIIPWLRKLKFGQTILEIGPKWHEKKQGTPTMGGVMIVLGVVLSLAVVFCISFAKKGSLYTDFNDNFSPVIILSGIIMALLMGAIGFIDDYIKVVKKRNLGLTARQKTFMQLLVSAGYLATLALGGMDETYLPFIGRVNIIHGFGLIFWPIALMFIYGFTNAVNLTDGLDGLASSVTLVVACAFMLAANFLNLSSSNALSASLAGACAGFIVWNANPAKVFMGDTGSMFLGGMVVALSFAIERPVLLLIMGGVYLIEALSVIIQVTHYKRTKKRIFKMAPIHHHFEMSGFSEEKIVLLFSAVTVIFCFVALLSIVFSW